MAGLRGVQTHPDGVDYEEASKPIVVAYDADRNRPDWTVVDVDEFYAHDATANPARASALRTPFMIDVWS